jgi:maltose alpha-D-glucosyltransferase / alpha-amylase
LDSKEKPNTEIKDPEEFLERLRSFVSSRKKDAILLGEVNLPLQQLRMYIKDSKRLELLFNFLLNRTIFLAFTRKDVKPIIAAFKKLQTVSKTPHWANFLRNLDELNLEYISPEEMQEVYAKYAPEFEMRIYNRGIRRRLAPLFGGKKEKIAMAFALIFSLPGTPLFIYGDEIGMGDNLFLTGRTCARIPMQWNNTKNGGFSHAESSRYVDRVIHHGHYSYKKINVDNQQTDPDSLLQTVKKIIKARKKCPEIGLEESTFVRLKAENILCINFNDKVITITNLANQETTISLKRVQSTKFEEILNDQKYPTADFASLPVNPYGYRWFRRKENI